MKNSFKDSLKALEADIQHANTLASNFSREYDGACLQMRLSYSPCAQLFMFIVQLLDCQLASALGLIRILVYKAYEDGKTTMSVSKRKASLREIYGVIFPSLLQLQRGISDVEERKQREIIFSFVRRPKAVITRSQYIKEATELAKKARELKKTADALHQEERSGGKGRKWRKNVKAVEKRMRSALIWVVVTAIICALVLAILYGLIGKVDFTVRHLSSTTMSFPSTFDFSTNQECVGTGAKQCSAYSASASSETTWTMRTTFPEYVVALTTIVGSVLFTIFGGVGIACLPLGLIFSFVRRPKAVITRSQYIKEATELAKKARELKKTADALHQEERSGGKGRKWRKNVKAVEKELLLLEEDVNALEEMYPQGEKAEAMWAMTVLGYLAKLVLGVLGLIVSVAWIVHIVIYLLIDPPVSSFLNEIFIKLDDVWGLLGTVAFAFFCFYLLLAVIAGAMMLGLKLVFVTIHPMKWGATLMNSFLFNVGLILLSSISVIQFCATAFGYYAQATAAQEIFGHTLQSLRGIKYLYKYNVFQIAFIILAGLTFVYYAAFGWRRKKTATGRLQLAS